MLRSALRQYWFTGAATVVVVATAAYYVTFGESETNSKEKKQKEKSKNKLSGLVNEGNTCFINTTLQALASCSVFTQWIDLILGNQPDITELETASSLHMTMAGNPLLSNENSLFVNSFYFYNFQL